MENGNGLWTLDGLTAAVAEALASGYEGAPSGRVRDIPDRRTIRYYTTLGLIDRPAEMRGRTALYDRTHLVQIVAIKKLQAEGKSLAEIQQAIVGRPIAEVGRIAETPAAAIGDRDQAERDFWKQEPTAPVLAKTNAPNADRPKSLVGIPIHPALTVLLAPLRPLDDDDLEAIQDAAAGLMRTLSQRHLIDLSEGGHNP